jgi:hypothetical protein
MRTRRGPTLCLVSIFSYRDRFQVILLHMDRKYVVTFQQLLHILTKRNKILVVKLIVAHVVKRFPVFYGT